MAHSAEHDPLTDAKERGYQTLDENVKGLLWFVIIFIATAIVLHTGLWFLLMFLFDRPRAEAAAKSTVPMIDRYPDPNLQPVPNHHRFPWDDLRLLKEEQAKAFEAMGWAGDPETGGNRIPAEIVKELARRYPAAATGGTGTGASSGTTRPASRESRPFVLIPAMSPTGTRPATQMGSRVHPESRATTRSAPGHSTRPATAPSQGGSRP